ncbi:MAG: hypothetical protein JWQ04_1285, partial [Pedosphaera sp.]|nr:hypothetical protein [Pedosphaera sp.]
MRHITRVLTIALLAWSNFSF